MYKLIASDVDDTLLAHDGSLPEATHQALQKLHENGVAVVLSSGRATASMRPIAGRIMDLADDEYLISYNGARVVTAKSDEVIFEEPVPQQLLGKITDYCRKNALYIQAYEPEGFLVEKDAHRCAERAERYSRLAGLPFRTVSSIADALKAGSTKLLIVDDHDVLLTHQQALIDLTGGECSVMFSKPHYMEIVSAGVSKGKALTILAERLDIPLSQCIALGDSTNDIEMIQTAGLGVAVSNARQELKDVSDAVLERSADESAIVELVERYFPEIL